MKSMLSIFLISISAIMLCGCESMGFNPRGVGEALTPGIDAETTVRTWSVDKDSQPVPVEKEVANPQAFE